MKLYAPWEKAFDNCLQHLNTFYMHREQWNYINVYDCIGPYTCQYTVGRDIYEFFSC